MSRTGQRRRWRWLPWGGIGVAAAIAGPTAAVSTSLPARQAANPSATRPPELIAHYDLTKSLFEVNRTHSPLIVGTAPVHPGRGIFCNGEYAVDWPDGCDVRTPLLKSLDFSSFTISARFLAPRPGPRASPVFVLGRSSRALAFVLQPNGRIVLLTNNSARTECSVRYRTGFWHEATVSFDGETTTLYLDGVAGCRAKGPLQAGNDRIVTLTNYAGGETYYGFLRELKIYNGVAAPERRVPAADAVPAPEPIHVPPVDRFLAACPTADQVAAVNGDLRLEFDSDPTAREPLACRSSHGSRDLSPMKRRVYNTLLLMQHLQFDQPLPWTGEPLYRWLTSAIRGIRFRADVKNSFCCNPERVINLAVGPAATPTDRWVDPALGPAVGMYGQMLLVVHEARHADGHPHSCGSNDRTLEELGSWGVQYYLHRWLTEHTDQAFFSSGPRNYNVNLKGREQTILENHICGK
jgi:hypothetical protein